MIIDKCKNCEYFDVPNNRQKNKLYCTFGCKEQNQKALVEAIKYEQWAEKITGEKSTMGEEEWNI